MRRSASEVINNLESRIARLEKQARSPIVGRVGVNIRDPKAKSEAKTWSSAKAFFKEVDALGTAINLHDTGNGLIFMGGGEPYINVTKESLLLNLIEEGTSSKIVK